MLAFVLCCLLQPAATPDAVPQGDPADAATEIARYRLLDKTAAITRGDVALEMAFHLRRKDDGRAAVAQLVKSLLVRRAARAAGVWPAPDEVRRRWDDLRQQLQAAGRDLAAEPIVRNCSETTLLDYLAIDLAHEQIVRRELALRQGEQVSPAMLELWTTEARERATIVDDPERLPIGVAVRVDDTDVPLLDLGLLLLRSSDEAEQDKFVQQVVVLQILEAKAREQGLLASDDELQRELSLRRAQAESDARFGGLSFEQLLETQGLSVAWLLQSRVFRAQVLQKKLVARAHPRAELQAILAADRTAAAERYGPRRRLGIVFARALEPPNQLVPRDFAAAQDHLRTVRLRLAQEPFDKVARIDSEDPGTRLRGGDCGWLARRSELLPEPVLAAAWQLRIDDVSEPIRTDSGCYLVKVQAIEPDLSDEVLLERMRERLVETFTQELLQAAAIERIGPAVPK